MYLLSFVNMLSQLYLLSVLECSNAGLITPLITPTAIKLKIFIALYINIHKVVNVK